MRFRPCSMEVEVAAAVRAGNWPDGCGPALRAHVAACPECADFVRVAQAFVQARSRSLDTAPAGQPGLLWWRAQIRRRQAALRQVSRPIVVAEIVAFLAAVMGLGISAWRWNQVTQWFRAALEFLRLDPVPLPSASPAAASSGWMIALTIAAVGTVALFGGIAVYLAARRD